MAVRYTQALLDRATAYVAKSVQHRREGTGPDDMMQLLADITGEAVAPCRQCQYSDYFARVRAYINQATRFLHPETVATSTHSLKPEFANETFVHESYGKSVIGSEMTAEDAKFFQKHYPHAFSDSAQPGARASVATSEGDAPAAEPSEGEKKAHADLATEQKAHADSKGKLTKATDALKTEKDAHTATKADLKKTQVQVKELQTQLEKLTKEVAKAAQAAADATEQTDEAAK